MAKFTPEETVNVNDDTDFVAPTSEEYNEPALDTTVDGANTVTEASGIASEAEPLLTIFIKQLDDLHLFVTGRWPDNTKDGRRKFIINNLKLFENIANAQPQIALAAIQHFIANVISAPRRYIDGSFNSPIYPFPRAYNVDRYLDLINLLITVADEITHVYRFLAGRDLGYILRAWPVKQRTTLIAIINSFNPR